MHILTKFFITSNIIRAATTSGLIQHDWIQLGSMYLHVVRLDKAHMGDILAVFGMALPGLNAPATSLSSDLLTQIGVTPSPGDCVINVLRSWRNANGQTASSFDISELS